MNEFKKYSEIQNSYQTPYIDKVRESIDLGYFDKDMPWVVTEKIHGTNFSLITDGKEIIPAKRTSILTGNDKFYNFQTIVEKYHDNVIALFNDIVENYYENVSYAQLFFELYGGNYPHPDVERLKNVSSVQKGVYYRPDNDIYGFDIRVTFNDGTSKYVDQVQMHDLYRNNGFFPPTVMFTGTLEECLNYPNAFQTTIPQRLGIPEIENNICEGVVIKPMQDVRLANGDRPLIKNKNEKFKEVSHGTKGPKPEVEVSPECEEMIDIIRGYVNDNRLNNVISHNGEYEMPKGFGALIKDFTADILKDFLKDNEEKYNLIEKNEQKIITKQMTSAASKVIKKHYNING